MIRYITCQHDLPSIYSSSMRLSRSLQRHSNPGMVTTSLDEDKKIYLTLKSLPCCCQILLKLHPKLEIADKIRDWLNHVQKKKINAMITQSTCKVQSYSHQKVNISLVQCCNCSTFCTLTTIPFHFLHLFLNEKWCYCGLYVCMYAYTMYPNSSPPHNLFGSLLDQHSL